MCSAVVHTFVTQIVLHHRHVEFASFFFLYFALPYSIFLTFSPAILSLSPVFYSLFHLLLISFWHFSFVFLHFSFISLSLYYLLSFYDLSVFLILSSTVFLRETKSTI